MLTQMAHQYCLDIFNGMPRRGDLGVQAILGSVLLPRRYIIHLRVSSQHPEAVIP